MKDSGNQFWVAGTAQSGLVRFSLVRRGDLRCPSGSCCLEHVVLTWDEAANLAAWLSMIVGEEEVRKVVEEIESL
ncbi:MAG: hypothetical protein KGL39_27875 [Patescibacteria group bacterium]|nr:hypothetical protein [Patescibacteria group bacterium]